MVNDDIPLDLGVEEAFRQLRLNKASRNTHLCAEHFKKFLQEAYPAEGTSTPPQYRTLSEAGGTDTIHVEAREYPNR